MGLYFNPSNEKFMKDISSSICRQNRFNKGVKQGTLYE